MCAQLAVFLSHWEIIIVLVIALLLFGTRLPKVARSLGQGVREFKGGIAGIKKDVDDAGEKPKATAVDSTTEEGQ